MNENFIKKVESGEYFKEAQGYYFKKHVYQLVIQHYLYVLVIILGFAAFLLVKSALLTFEVEKLPLPLKFDGGVDSYPVLRKISSAGKTPEQEVADYLLRKYVINREEYNVRDLEKKRLESKTNLINAFSSRRIFNEYNNFINVNTNPNSPYIRYKRIINREITIKDVKFNNDNGGATVYFSSVERKQKKILRKENWQADITYTMTKIKPQFEGRKFHFLVREYKLKKLNKKAK